MITSQKTTRTLEQRVLCNLDYSHEQQRRNPEDTLSAFNMSSMMRCATTRRALILPASRVSSVYSLYTCFSTVASRRQDPRYNELPDREIIDEYAALRDKYLTPKNPIILAHGLLGFEELHIAGPKLPGLKYWRGIKDALEQKNIEVIVTAVPASGSLEARAAKLAEVIAQKAQGKSVNIIAYVQYRYMQETHCLLGR